MSLFYGTESPSHTPPVPAAIYSDECGGVTFTPDAGTRCVYVDSADGNDNYDGLYPDHNFGGIHGPKSSIHCAYRLLRNGHPDWMLLRCGSVWSGDTINNGDLPSNVWSKSGQDASNHMLIGAYGSGEYPLILGGSKKPLILNQSATVLYLSTTHIRWQPGPAYSAPIPGGNYSSAGWTVFSASPDTAVIYVSSSSGNDNNNGTDPTLAKATISAGKALLRSGKPDWLLLKCGDTFGTLNSGPGQNFGQFGGGSVSGGRSASEPMVISSYGDGVRPIVYANMAYTGGNCVFLSNNAPAAGNLAFTSIHLHSGCDGVNACTQSCYGMLIIGPHNNILIEDMRIEKFSGNIATGNSGGAQNAVTNVIIRRNVVMHANMSGNSFAGQGLIMGESGNILIEENCFLQNGYINLSEFNWNRHNVYLQSGMPNVIFRGNVLTDSDGVQQRCGGTMVNNLGLHLAFHFQFGIGSDPSLDPNGTQGIIKGNVAIDGGPDFAFGQGGRGSAYILGNTNGVEMCYNIAANNVTGTSPCPIILGFDNHFNGQNLPGLGVQNTNIHHNVVYGWGGNGIRNGLISFYEGFPASGPYGGAAQVFNVTVANNDLQNSVDNSYLFDLNFVGSNGQNIPLAQIHHSANRYWSALGNPSALFADVNGNRAFVQAMQDFGDTTSTFAPVSNYHINQMSIVAYIQAIGGNAATLADYVADLVLQRKQGANWINLLMPTQVQADIPAGTAFSSYPEGPVNGTGLVLNGPMPTGPLQFIREAFNKQDMGITVQSVNPSSGGSQTVTVTGSGFAGAILPNVYFQNAPAVNVHVVNDTTITCVVPPNPGAGSVPVIVDTGNGYQTKAGGYLYT